MFPDNFLDENCLTVFASGLQLFWQNQSFRCGIFRYPLFGNFFR
ncbi:hypothetical protein EVA_21116 [gut metagenome]|uniref:Uncharacterized protein n=1 Tax=gut metagenome TaxID=749906 RepID=J9FMD1_9ZZZZ